MQTRTVKCKLNENMKFICGVIGDFSEKRFYYKSYKNYVWLMVCLMCDFLVVIRKKKGKFVYFENKMKILFIDL